MFGIGEMISGALGWVSAGLGAAVVTTGLLLRVAHGDIDYLELQLQQQSLNYELCRAKRNKQNEAIVILAADYNASVERWNNRVPSVEYVDRWYTKYVDRNVTTVVESNATCGEVLEAINKYGF